MQFCINCTFTQSRTEKSQISRSKKKESWNKIETHGYGDDGEQQQQP